MKNKKGRFFYIYFLPLLFFSQIGSVKVGISLSIIFLY